MKRISLLILAMIAGYCCTSQTRKQVTQLATLGKVWGFLKYYHPSALKGKPDWDNELLRLIPLTEQAASKRSFDSLLQNWYRSLPEARLAAQPVNWLADSVVRTFTEKNIEQFAIAKSLKKELVKLYHYHIPDTSRYITRYYSNYFLDHIVHTEDAHEKPSYPSREMRLLALFRYWNTIEYFYPHKQRTTNWDRVLPAYIPKFLQASDSIEYRRAIRELIHELPDSHSFMQEPGAGYYFYPFRIDYIQGRFIIGECDSLIAANNDYRPGDEVIAINGKKTLDKVNELLKISTGTNRLSRYRNIAQEMLKDGDTVVQVTFKRNRQTFVKQIALHSWPVHSRLQRAPVPPLWQQIEQGIWLVRFCKIKNPDTLRVLFKDISRAKAVIWDMRAYPDYKVTTELYPYLFSSKTVFTEEMCASDFFPGSFIKGKYAFTPDAGEMASIYAGPMVVLVDEHTQSLSESVAAVLKLRHNTITIGRQTAGTTGNITWLSLPGGIDVSYTGVGVTGMQGTFRQGEGVKVDVPVALTVARVAEGDDYLLARAVEMARKMAGEF